MGCPEGRLGELADAAAEARQAAETARVREEEGKRTRWRSAFRLRERTA
ncbi:hypothetical protein MMF93_29605 [Streptomyces tubbatahanensis]|uniref:Uncharacterized protein n=1 Tax=Streptomyces tubbatahanensis TaxID=2923272 RepID=A0ABY3Y058_9ACTN|nr:hypothetical protein [Streptomyces tubbatahanensis]UNT00148.1 hypothetical protein MMF93_29605 [Streptomyces tubbatahanensis]